MRSSGNGVARRGGPAWSDNVRLCEVRGLASPACGLFFGHRWRFRLMSVSERWVVLLHGQPGSGADWQQVADRLPDGIGVLAPDRPGYGASPRQAGGFAAGARAVVAELDARGIARAVLVGHS